MPGRGSLAIASWTTLAFERGALQPFGHVVLPLPQDVGDLLPIAGKTEVVEATIEVNHVAPLIELIVGCRMDVRNRLTRGRVPPLNRSMNLEPGLGVHAQRRDLLVEKPLDVRGPGHSRRDDLIRERPLGDHIGRQHERPIVLKLIGESGVEIVFYELARRNETTGRPRCPRLRTRTDERRALCHCSDRAHHPC